VEAASDYSPESVAEASGGIDDAVAESTAAAEASAPSTAEPVESVDSTGTDAGLGDVADEPVAAGTDPLDGTPDLGTGEATGAPAESTAATEDPLDGTSGGAPGEFVGEPVKSTATGADPLDGTSDRDTE
jgi:hypothetical protein